MKPVNIKSKFALFKDQWSPKVVGELNGQQVKLARLEGEFVRHQHEQEDELFLVIEGSLEMEYDDRVETIEAGEFVIVPRGVYHKPIAKREVKVLLFEPASTLNTGNLDHELTQRNLENI